MGSRRGNARRRPYADGSVAAAAIGGGTGTWMTEVLGALPHGFPKLLVSTLSGRDATRDITVMPSVVDIAGVNRLLAPVLANAAAAISGMAEGVAVEALPALGTVVGDRWHREKFAGWVSTLGGGVRVVVPANGSGADDGAAGWRRRVKAVVDWTTVRSPTS
jgi:hypothetical protein